MSKELTFAGYYGEKHKMFFGILEYQARIIWLEIDSKQKHPAKQIQNLILIPLVIR